MNLFPGQQNTHKPSTTHIN